MKKFLAIAICLLLVASLASCTSQAPSSAPDASTPTPTSSSNTSTSTPAPPSADPAAPPRVITILRPLYEAQPYPDNSPAQLLMEEALNVKFEYIWVPTGTFTETFNTTLATRDIPNIIVVPSSLTVNPGFMKYCNAGVFYDLTDRINNNPVFWEQGVIDETSLKASSVDGKAYTFPLIVQACRVAVLYREDWRQAVNAPVPDSVDNFYTMAKMFTENDPNGSGVKDTYGFAYIDDDDKELAYAGLTTIAVGMGAPNLWGKDAGGKFYPYFESNEYMDALNLFKDMYNNGYMNDDFYLIKGNDKYSPMLAGKAGMMMTSATNAAYPNGKFDPLIAEDPNVKIGYFNTFKQADGSQITNSLISVGALGGLIFPKNSNTDADIDFYMDMIAKMKGTPELDILMIFGVEGVHHTVDGGVIKQTPEQISLQKEDGSWDAFESLWPRRILNEYGQQLTPVQEITKAILPNNSFVKPDEAAGRMDGSMLEKQNSIATIISDARVQYILGRIDEAGFKAQIQAWKDAGGQDIIDGLSAG